ARTAVYTANGLVLMECYRPLRALGHKVPVRLGIATFDQPDWSDLVDPAVFDLGVPILGICYGMQLLAKRFEADVARGAVREYGRANRPLVHRCLVDGRAHHVVHGGVIDGVVEIVRLPGAAKVAALTPP
ncbi:glutamine amidotransferase-related protein, partial [Alicyclobacillus acidocaldarius]|uniref:glutamine amidotransferase-related protein n=1 Tax=Alicyclobacillus acidocaldarius TaxID=405212 RepID=UPI003F53FA36